MQQAATDDTIAWPPGGDGPRRWENQCMVSSVRFCFSKPRDWLGELLQNDPFCVEWDVKPQLSQPDEPVSAGPMVLGYLPPLDLFWKRTFGDVVTP